MVYILLYDVESRNLFASESRRVNLSPIEGEVVGLHLQGFNLNFIYNVRSL